MQIGCGLRVMRVKGRRYIYVWHYELSDGGRRQVYEYIGSVDDPESGRKAADAMEEYVQKAIDEARRRLQSDKAKAMAAVR